MFLKKITSFKEMYILASDAFAKKRKGIYINCVKKNPARIALQKIASL